MKGIFSANTPTTATGLGQTADRELTFTVGKIVEELVHRMLNIR